MDTGTSPTNRRDVRTACFTRHNGSRLAEPGKRDAGKSAADEKADRNIIKARWFEPQDRNDAMPAAECDFCRNSPSAGLEARVEQPKVSVKRRSRRRESPRRPEHVSHGQPCLAVQHAARKPASSECHIASHEQTQQSASSVSADHRSDHGPGLRAPLPANNRLQAQIETRLPVMMIGLSPFEVICARSAKTAPRGRGCWGKNSAGQQRQDENACASATSAGSWPLCAEATRETAAMIKVAADAHHGPRSRGRRRIAPSPQAAWRPPAPMPAPTRGTTPCSTTDRGV